MKLSPIDRMVLESEARSPDASYRSSMGSLYTPGAPLAEGYRDLRASRVDDIVTVMVSDRASAISRGATASKRSASAKGGVQSVFSRSIKPLSDLASVSGEQELQSQGATERESSLTTALTARVTRVLPNGVLLIEGQKEVSVNSERQTVYVRGLIRTFDISTSNTVRSDRLANLEVRVNGKGVVGDAIRRPNFLYRLLTGILPF